MKLSDTVLLERVVAAFASAVAEGDLDGGERLAALAFSLRDQGVRPR